MVLGLELLQGTGRTNLEHLENTPNVQNSESDQDSGRVKPFKVFQIGSFFDVMYEFTTEIRG